MTKTNIYENCSHRKKLHEYVDTGNEKKVKAIFSLVENEIEENIWTDEFLAEMNKRSEDLESGKVKCIRWNDVKKSARQLIKSYPKKKFRKGVS